MLHFCPTKPMPFWNNMDLLTCQPSKLDNTTPLIHIWNFGLSGMCSCHFFTLPCKHDNSENSPWAFHLLENINRSAQSGVSSNYGRIERFPKKLGVVCHCCVSHRHGPPPSLLTSMLLSKYGAAHPSWFLFNCALPKLYQFTRFLDLRAFADFCWRFAGTFGRSYMHLYSLVLGIWEWPGMSLGRRQDASHVQLYSKCQLWW